jgi:hypothetical protein
MAKYQRIPGGEKNENSGKKWSKEELFEVLKLYVSNPSLRVHESSIEIHNLSKLISRTARSIEAQLLMFRNLDKHGDYGYGNMSKLCKELWMEYLNSHKPE